MTDRALATGELATFGHGTAGPGEIVEMLHAAGIAAVVDVRSAPGSRRNPHMARSELERWLPESRIGYRHDKRLGGFRKVPEGSPDTVWERDAFRAYAGHARTPAFLAAVDELLGSVPATRTAVMCSESVWWRCHRRIIADFVQVARGVTVRHLMHDGRVMAHQPTAGARLRDDGLLVYDAGHQHLPAEE